MNDDTLDVAESTHFSVAVRDSVGAPVPNIEIACDTETGLGLIEPNTGYELTDGHGNMSGVVGCELPGSFRMGCRLPQGAYKRQFATIKCAGPIPSGFTGFPGAGGGTLGIGSGPGGGVANPGEIRLTAIVASENGAATSSVDVYRDSCGRIDTNGDGDTTDACDLKAEAFTDTSLTFKVTNSSSERVFLRSFTYQLANSDGFGNPFTSSALAFSSGGEVGPSSSAELTGLFLRAGGAGNPACAAYPPADTIGMRKYFTGKSVPIPVDLGFSNVTFTLSGVMGAGTPFTVTGRVGLSFGNYNRCS